MERTRRQPRQAQCVQQLGDRSLGHRHLEALLDNPLKIDAAPSHNAIFGKIGTVQHDLFQLVLLRCRQQRRRPAAMPVRKPSQTSLVVAMHPIAQRRPIADMSGE